MPTSTVKLDKLYFPHIDFKQQDIRHHTALLLIVPEAVKVLQKTVYQINKTALFSLDGEHYYSALMFNSTGGLTPTWHLYAVNVESEHPVLADKFPKEMIKLFAYAPIDVINASLTKNKFPSIKESHYKIVDDTTAGL